MRRLGDALDTLGELVDTAPAEILADLVNVRDGVEDFVGGGRAPTADLTAAGGRVTRHLGSGCGVQSEGGS